MASRSRLSDDAFDWIQDTTTGREAATPNPPPEVDTPAAEPNIEETREGHETDTIDAQLDVEREGERSIFVKYRKDNGDIVSIREVLPNRGSTRVPWASIPDDMAVHEFALVGELLDKRIIEIHHQCHVTTSGSRPQLTRKT